MMKRDWQPLQFDPEEVKRARLEIERQVAEDQELDDPEDDLPVATDASFR
jgi:hypothetical protein